AGPPATRAGREAAEFGLNRRSKSERPAGPPATRAGREAAEFGLNRLGRLGASALLAVALLVGTAAGCTAGESTRERAAVDTRLDTHAVIEGEPSEAGLRYVQAIAEAHRTADRLSD